MRVTHAGMHDKRWERGKFQLECVRCVSMYFRKRAKCDMALDF